MDPDGRLMSAEVTLNTSSIDVGPVQPLGITVLTGRGSPYDVSLDGQRFLAITDASTTEGDSPGTAQIQVVLNWFEELKRLVPTN